MIASLDLKSKWEELKQENKALRIRDAATKLGVSEMELIHTGVGENATKLEADWLELLKNIGKLGRVMALTRNEGVVHERKGEYQNISFGKHQIGTALGEDIDLRLFMFNWHNGYAVDVANPRGTMKSLQFFDEFGDAVHKIFLLPDSNSEEYESMVSRYKSNDQDTILRIERKEKRETTPNEVNRALLVEKWEGMKDTHDFHGMVHQLKITRMQALRNVGENWAYKLNDSAVDDLLYKAAETQLDIMAFVGNRGCLQIHTGKVSNIKPVDKWINVMDPEFNLHVNKDEIGEIWVVKKPTTDGIVTSVEVYDKEENNTLLFFGKRKPGLPENEDWRNLVTNLV